MHQDMLQRFEAMLAAGQDTPLLRVSLGQGYLAGGDPEVALRHLTKALEMQPDYSAAWKHLGKAHEAANDPAAAADAYRRGIRAAENHGDLQLVREMQVFLRRIEKRQRGTC